jgi:ADP-ribose pyrophosphatase
MPERDASGDTWHVLQRREMLDARPWLRVFLEIVRLPNGSVIDNFSAVEMPEYVNVVAVTRDGRAVLTHGYKHGLRRTSYHLPGGYLEPGEAPQEAAQRELLEETGYIAERWEALGSFVVDGNRGCGTGHLFLATAAYAVTEPDSGDLEEAAVGLLELDDVLNATRQGGIGVLSNAAAIGLALVTLRSRPMGE